jgi:hypothetical protein
MSRNSVIAIAVALLLGAGVAPGLPGVTVRPAAAADEPRASAHESAGAGLVSEVARDTRRHSASPRRYRSKHS